MVTSQDWKHFERLVAAIHALADRGADVRWNEKIGGRQFDVVIRFKKGLYDYLTVIECKHTQNPVPASDLDAFVTKSRDAQAHYAVVASTSGFQEGAEEVARRHDIALIHVTDDSEIDLSLIGARYIGEVEAFNFHDVELEYKDGERWRFPEHPAAMVYYAAHLFLENPRTRRPVIQAIYAYFPTMPEGKIDEFRDYVIPCEPETRVVVPPNEDVPSKEIANIHVRAGRVIAKTIDGPIKLDTALLLPDVRIRHIRTGEEQTFKYGELSLGLKNTFVEGQFYELVPYAMYYYCNKIENQAAHLYLVESFQHGTLIQGELCVRVRDANRYVPINDKGTVGRLKRRLADVLKLVGQQKA
jgi:hypothetical protein